MFHQVHAQRIRARRPFLERHFQHALVRVFALVPLQHIRAVHRLDAEAIRHGEFQREYPDALDHIIHRRSQTQLFIAHADVIAHDGFHLRLQRRHTRFQSEFRFQKTKRARDARHALTRRRRAECRRVHALQLVRATHREFQFVIRAQRHQARLAFHVERMGRLHFRRGRQRVERLLGFHGQPIVRHHAFEQFDHENLFAVLLLCRPGADGFAFHAQQPLPGGQLHARRAQLALRDLIIQHRPHTHHAATERNQRCVLAHDRGRDFRRALHARCPRERHALARADERVEPRALRLRDALERNRAGEFHIRIRLINRQCQPARQRRRDGERQLPFRHVAAETHEQLELQRRFALARQQHRNRFAFTHDLRVARLGTETLHCDVFTEERDLLTRLRCVHLNRGVKLCDTVVHGACVAGGKNRNVGGGNCRLAIGDCRFVQGCGTGGGCCERQ